MKRSNRSGVSALEVVAATVLIGTLLAFVVPSFLWADRQVRLAQRHQIAIEAVSNVLDDVSGAAYDSLTSERLAETPCPDWARDEFPDPVLELKVSEIEDGKRIAATLTWNGDNQIVREKVTLVAWVFGKATP